MSVDMSLPLEIVKRLDSEVQFMRFGSSEYGCGPKSWIPGWLVPLLYKQGAIFFPGNIWQCLQIFLFVTTGEGGTIGTYWVEARDPVKHLTVHR